MARSYGALKVAVWEPSSDFRNLTVLGQWAYVLLISQPQLNNLGLLPYTPEKWVRFAAALTNKTLGAALLELRQESYVVIDGDTGELLVRTFIKHDKVWQQPKLITNARRLIREVESPALRDVLTTRHPWLTNDWTKDEIERYELAADLIRQTPTETPSDTPIEQAVDNASADPVERGIETPSDTHIPTRAPAGPGPGVGGSPSTVTRTRAVNEASSEGPDGEPSEADDGTALDLELDDYNHLLRGMP